MMKLLLPLQARRPGLLLGRDSRTVGAYLPCIVARDFSWHRASPYVEPVRLQSRFFSEPVVPWTDPAIRDDRDMPVCMPHGRGG